MQFYVFFLNHICSCDTIPGMPNIFIFPTGTTAILGYIKPIKGLPDTVLLQVKRLQLFRLVLLLRNFEFKHTRKLGQ
jgi:hypothetical protein